jgi:hypothetical protein
MIQAIFENIKFVLTNSPLSGTEAVFENIKFVLTNSPLSGTEDCTTSEITQSCPSPTIGPFLHI